MEQATYLYADHEKCTVLLSQTKQEGKGEHIGTHIGVWPKHPHGARFIVHNHLQNHGIENPHGWTLISESD